MENADRWVECSLFDMCVDIYPMSDLLRNVINSRPGFRSQVMLQVTILLHHSDIYLTLINDVCNCRVGKNQ